jgi:hypothetical protein
VLLLGQPAGRGRGERGAWNTNIVRMATYDRYASFYTRHFIFNVWGLDHFSQFPQLCLSDVAHVQQEGTPKSLQFDCHGRHLKQLVTTHSPHEFAARVYSNVFKHTHRQTHSRSGSFCQIANIARKPGPCLERDHKRVYLVKRFIWNDKQWVANQLGYHCP